MRRALVAIAVVVASGLVACGGNSEAAKPLTLEQRLIRESDAPGSREDPVETRLTADNLDELIAWPNPVAEIDPGKLKKAGFVAAVHDTRFFPKTPGGPHTRDARHVRSLVIQFRSKEGAATGAGLVYTNSLKPCPGECAFQIEEFEPSGVPDARGVRRYITAKRAQETGSGEAPGDGYTITFADGPFVYEVEGFGPLGKISRKQVEAIAEKAYDRVKGAPPVAT
jgi:hypothetical protein